MIHGSCRYVPHATSSKSSQNWIILQDNCSRNSSLQVYDDEKMCKQTQEVTSRSLFHHFILEVILWASSGTSGNSRYPNWPIL